MIGRIFQFFFKKHRTKTLFVFGVLLLWYLFALPKPLFKDPTCMVLEAADGELLGARIASDGQWRFPHQAHVPEKFAVALTTFEDHRFYKHWGIDPIAVGRAVVQNIRNRKIVSGGSTLSIQVMRMARKNKPRTLWQKVLEAILATRLEWSYSKKEILALYASHAPFGGNVVGLDAATWRYYGKQARLLSWGEAATLAVLPNSPGLIHPGRNRDALRIKRNRLLDKLYEQGSIDKTTQTLAKEEPLPDRPKALPRLAPHLLDKAYLDLFYKKQNAHTRLRTTIQTELQTQVNRIIKKHHNLLVHNDIHNLSALVIEVETGNILAYVGNEIGAGDIHGQAVDVIPAPRSTGSILKPFLMAHTLQDGLLLPSSLLSDIPTQMSGYRPENYYETYDGMVPLHRALSRSLNVPFIRLLSKYGLEKFHADLQKLGFQSITQAPSHYGLPLILGGAEASLWDISNAYAGMARTLQHFVQYDSRYLPNDFRPLNYQYKASPSDTTVFREAPPVLGAGAIWHTFEAMQQLERPTSAGNWEVFRSSRNIAWKTGTSFGFRDAWAVGLDPHYVVGVWVGNADGEGRPGLIGIKAAAPVLFDIFELLPRTQWFDPPYDDMQQIPVCSQSGYRALDICPKDSLWVPLSGLQVRACTYHRIYHLDESGTAQVHADCAQPHTMLHRPYFVLPPIEAHYYKIKHPHYIPPPPYRADCATLRNHQSVMQLIYPNQATQIVIPIDLDGQKSSTVFRVAHRDAETPIYWHLDRVYLGSTQTFHEMELNPDVGVHTLTLVDENGNRLEQVFEVVSE